VIRLSHRLLGRAVLAGIAARQREESIQRQRNRLDLGGITVEQAGSGEGGSGRFPGKRREGTASAREGNIVNVNQPDTLGPEDVVEPGHSCIRSEAGSDPLQG
jgi:hypothetical protein